MTKLIYNEGRVTGLSSYEEYVRQLKSVDPTFDACTEREFLSASLAMGTSVILKVPAGCGIKVGSSNIYMYEVEFPDNCHLAAGNPVTGSYFYGECDTDSRGWATVVKDYGSLISNTSSSHPEETATSVNTDTVPLGDIQGELEIPDTDDLSSIEFTQQQIRLNEYVKIVDGLVIQPGYWNRSNVDAPYEDFTPDLTKRPVFRLTLMEPVANDFYIQITGLTNRSILRGISKFDFGSTETENKQDGDFIGCECYPWAAKVQFISSPAVDYMMKSMMRRGSRNVKIETYNDSPLIKVTSNNLLGTTVYSRKSNTTTGSDIDNFGNVRTTWLGTNDASNWYGSTRDSNVTSTCDDPSFNKSGQESVTTYKLNNKYDNTTPLGFTVTNNYESDDRNTIKNGDHGGWYDIHIDPYQMIKDFIDEVIARFQYIDKRLDEIESEIGNEITHRKDGDKYILSQIYSGDGGLGQLIELINSVFNLVYNPQGTLNIHTEGTDVDLDDDYDEKYTGKITIPSLSWLKEIIPSDTDGLIPRAKLNIYSGDSSGSEATSFLRSRTDNSEDDLYAR